MTDALLTVSNLSKTFDGLKAVEDFSCTIAKSKIVGLIGPNGAGKTTVFNIITGFLAADAGEIHYAGKNITRLPPYRIAHNGIVRTFQDLRLIASLPVIENILLARQKQTGENWLATFALRKKVLKEEHENRQIALDILNQVGLANKHEHLAGALSYGQQKLLTLACCLAAEADLLLLDEPVSGVHPSMIEKMLALMAQLAASGKTILFIEHNLDVVMQVSDHVIVMDAGRKIMEGRPEAVKNDPEILEAYLE
ncbi:ABC transporter ATP-binding protein [candidate division KSB1 bacterium]|nr:MAG: ABC transporter ATP-binding protein [candidate division KSB1 bacterium]MCE7944637.1 ABC transporter ATP-binding protein [Chlorobi bacterium CHB1]MDL1876346.1 ABC transporter ATP-binding protein [Cytophagia bacterium CHB2]RIK75216.1 MAG: ABC transporter ATP-binding protein [candidate division KSB1 bacterium]